MLSMFIHMTPNHHQRAPLHGTLRSMPSSTHFSSKRRRRRHQTPRILFLFGLFVSFLSRIIILLQCLVAPSAAAKPPIVWPLRGRHHPRDLEQLVPINEDTDIDPLYRGLGTHYIDLWVGCNKDTKQRQTVIIDTGSSITGFPCLPECDQNCGQGGYHLNPPYQPLQSTCFQAIACGDCQLTSNIACRSSSLTADDEQLQQRCPIEVRYVEQSSWSGYECTDQVTAGTPNEPSLSLRFACQTELRGLFQTQKVDGILGLSKGPGNLVEQQQPNNERRQFALCFQWHFDVEGEAGSLSMGGTDTRLHDTPMVYASDCCSNTFYNVRLKELDLRVGGGESVRSVAGSSSNNNNNITSVNTTILGLKEPVTSLVDSGTTYTYFTEALREKFLLAWSQATNIPFGEQQILTQEQVDSLPTLIFHLEASSCQDNNGAVVGDLIQVAFPPSRYLYRNAITGAAQFDLYFHGRESNTLGANFISGHAVLFDIDNQRIGFAESRCDYSLIDATDDHYWNENNCSVDSAPTAEPSSVSTAGASILRHAGLVLSSSLPLFF